MEPISKIFICVFILGAFILEARRMAKHRNKLKARLKHEINNEIELTNEELESRLGEMELMYEQLEETYWAHTSALIGFLSYLYWEVWYFSVIIFFLVWFIGSKFLTLKPFKLGIPD